MAPKRGAEVLLSSDPECKSVTCLTEGTLVLDKLHSDMSSCATSAMNSMLVNVLCII